MIRLRGVVRSFSDQPADRVLQGIDLDVEDGELVAVLGRSGSGKTTLLNVIGGLDAAYEGTVEVGEHELKSLRDTALSDYRNREVGYVFQSFHLLEHLTCAENVALPALFSRGDAALHGAQAERRAYELLDRVGLASKAGQRPGKLSGGEKQRVAVARAMFNHPRLIICDEPTGNLDATTGQAIIDLFVELNGSDGITLLIATHDEAIADVATRVVRLVDGKIVAADRVSNPETKGAAP